MPDKEFVVGLFQAAFLIFVISLVAGYLLKSAVRVLAFFIIAFIPATFGTATFVFGRGTDHSPENWVAIIALSSLAILVGGILGAEIKISTSDSG